VGVGGGFMTHDGFMYSEVMQQWREMDSAWWW
jgi:hypothetical protein